MEITLCIWGGGGDGRVVAKGGDANPHYAKCFVNIQESSGRLSCTDTPTVAR